MVDTAASAWYAFVGTVGLLYSFQTFDTPILRRPFWASPAALRACGLLQRPAQVALPLACLAAAWWPEIWALRACVAAVWSVLDLYGWSCLGTHASFACLYTCLAMVLPAGEGRASALLVVAVHQLGSSGVQKARLGGWREWAAAETMAQTLRFSLQDSFWKGARNVVEPGEFVKARGLIRFVLERPWLCEAGGHGAMAVETVLYPAALFVPALRPAAMVLGCGLHAGIATLHGYVFAFNIACYMLAFWPSVTAGELAWSPLAAWPALANTPFACCVALAVASTVFNVEDWPLNHMGLYSYNHEQVAHVVSLWETFFLQPASAEARTRRSRALRTGYVRTAAARPICVAKYAVGLYPSTYRAQFAQALGLYSEPRLRPTVQQARDRLNAWLRRDRPFVCASTFEVLDGVTLAEPPRDKGNASNAPDADAGSSRATPSNAALMPNWVHGDT